MKKPNGSGTVYKVKGRKLRKPWRVIGPPPKRTNLGYVATKKEGEQLLLEYDRNPKPFEAPTLAELYDRLMRTKKFNTEKTRLMYITSWTYFSDIADEKITDIKSRHIQDLIDELYEDRGLSYSTAQKTKVLASQLYKMALADDYVDKNYAEFITLPKKPKPDNRTFTPEEIDKLKKAAKINVWAKMIVVLIYTVMRPSELLKTLKFNVHLDDNYIIAGGKTDAGTDRYIPIYGDIKPLITHFYKKSKTEYLITFNGKPVAYRYFLDRYYEVLEDLGITRLSPQKCRKTGITLYQNMGIDKIALQRIAGHASFETTNKYYTGDISKTLQDAIRVLNQK